MPCDRCTDPARCDRFGVCQQFRLPYPSESPPPNPAQLRAMVKPTPSPRPCRPGSHCERRARDLGACIAGECNPPAPEVADGVTGRINDQQGK